jgi:transcriptional regulator GlxA family with amidase domain
MPMAILIEPAHFESTQQTDRSPSLAATEELAALVYSLPQVRGGLPRQALQRVHQYVDAHLDEKVSVQALADVASLSIYHFARAFKQSEGLTPHDYLVQHRIEYAQKLLANSDVALSEVALAAGFFDQSHFAHRFREYVGVPPSRYRAIARRGGQPERYAAV